MAKNSGNSKPSLGPGVRGKQGYKTKDLGPTYNHGGSKNLLNTPEVSNPDQTSEPESRERHR